MATRPIRPDGVDKVTGRAAGPSDCVMPGMIWGPHQRSPYAHARIVSIDTKKALALPGVKAVVTGADFPDLASEVVEGGEAASNMRDLAVNVIARDKALYDGHAVAAVAAVSPAIAEAALDLIEVTYERLPHVIDVEAAMAPDAPLLHSHIFTEGLEERPTVPSNIARRHQFVRGDVAAALAEAEVRVEGRDELRKRAPGLYRVRTPAWLRCPRTARVRGAQARASLHGAQATAPRCWGSTSRTSASPRPRSAAASAARPPSTWSRSRSPCRASPARRVKLVMTRDEVFRATAGRPRAASSRWSSARPATARSPPPRWS